MELVFSPLCTLLPHRLLCCLSFPFLLSPRFWLPVFFYLFFLRRFLEMMTFFSKVEEKTWRIFLLGNSPIFTAPAI
jgi:hypothetical protein